MKIEQMAEEVEKLNITLTPQMEEQLCLYARLLQEWNEKINLTAITDPDQIAEKHFYDCMLALHAHMPQGSLCDVGSGAGFPGLVFKILLPQLHVTLLEPTQKKGLFLQETVNQLGLKDVEIVCERAEDYVKVHREIFDTVTARAVASLNVLAELCIPLLKIGGTFLVMKGSRALEEAAEAEHAIQVLGCQKKAVHTEQLHDGSGRINLTYAKVRHTPAEYPRAYGKIKKKPL